MHEHIHTISVERGGRTIAARRVFAAKNETNRIVTVPAGARGFLIHAPVDPDLMEALHIGSPDRECPLVPVPALSWARIDGEPYPQGLLCDNPSDRDVDVHVSCLHA